MNRIGLIAGNKKFPILVAKAAKAKGYFVVAVAIKGDTARALGKLVDKIYWLKLSEFSRMFEIFTQDEIKQVVMAGQISPLRIFSGEADQDKELRTILSSIKDKKADSIFSGIAESLQRAGLELTDSTAFIRDQLPKKGVLTKIQPDERLWQDINFGFELAKAVAGLDIGQTVAVKDKVIVAVEAFEGTDNLIRRAGRLAKGGVVVVKVSKPKQDARFDIPVVGLNTVKNLIALKARCLAIEADKTLFIDKQEALKLAESKGLVIVAL